MYSMRSAALIAAALLSFTMSSAQEVYIDEYFGEVAFAVSRSARERESLIRIKAAGYTKIESRSRSLNEDAGVWEETTDTLDVAERIRDLEELASVRVAARDSQGRPIVLFSSGLDCGSDQCYDTLEYDESGRVYSVKGWTGGDGSYFLTILYDANGRVRFFDIDAWLGGTHEITYDKSGRLKAFTITGGGSGVGDTRSKYEFVYGKDGLLESTTRYGNLVVVRKRDGSTDYRLPNQLKRKGVTKFRYLR